MGSVLHTVKLKKENGGYDLDIMTKELNLLRRGTVFERELVMKSLEGLRKDSSGLEVEERVKRDENILNQTFSYEGSLLRHIKYRLVGSIE